jgi:TPP-dependent pyruvate/acetoin dehydrogenase alpha subunit
VHVAREKLLELGVEENTLDDIDLEVDEEIEAAVKFAEESEPAREETMRAAVYAEEDES